MAKHCKSQQKIVMGQSMYWYILFIKTGREEKAEQLLKKQLDSNIFMPFIPMLQTIFKNSGRIRKDLKPLFPGYVFLESEVSSLEIIKNIRKIISASRDIIRFLQYEDTGDIAMREHEKNTLLRLCNADRYVESSNGIIIGTRIYIKEGPLMGMESIIRKIDRHKRQAIIELDFMGAVRQICVALEIIEKI